MCQNYYIYYVGSHADKGLRLRTTALWKHLVFLSVTRHVCKKGSRIILRNYLLSERKKKRVGLRSISQKEKKWGPWMSEKERTWLGFVLAYVLCNDLCRDSYMCNDSSLCNDSCRYACMCIMTHTKIDEKRTVNNLMGENGISVNVCCYL